LKAKGRNTRKKVVICLPNFIGIAFFNIIDYLQTVVEITVLPNSLNVFEQMYKYCSHLESVSETVCHRVRILMEAVSF